MGDERKTVEITIGKPPSFPTLVEHRRAVRSYLYHKTALEVIYDLAEFFGCLRNGQYRDAAEHFLLAFLAVKKLGFVTILEFLDAMMPSDNIDSPPPEPPPEADDATEGE